MQIVLHKQSNDIKLSMYAKNSNKIDLWTTPIESIEMQEIIHHENFLQIRASALHSVEILIRIWHPGKIWWRTLDPGDSFMDCAPPMMLLKCCIHILDTGLHEASIATLWFFHGLWSMMMLLHSVQSNVHSLGNTLLFVPQLQKKTIAN